MSLYLQANDRREDKHFEDGSGPSHGKRHRQRASPHRYLNCGSRYTYKLVKKRYTNMHKLHYVFVLYLFYLS